jgi:hypothetical protein
MLNAILREAFTPTPHPQKMKLKSHQKAELYFTEYDLKLLEKHSANEVHTKYKKQDRF